VGAVVAAVLLGGASGLAMGVWGPRPHQVFEADRHLLQRLLLRAEVMMEDSEYDGAEVQFALAAQLFPFDSKARVGLTRVASGRENAEHLRKAREALAQEDLGVAALELKRAQGPLHVRERVEVEFLRNGLQVACDARIERLRKTFLDDEDASREEMETIQWACPGRALELGAFRELLNEAPAVRDVRMAFRDGDASRALKLAHGCARKENLCAKLERDLARFVGHLKRLDAMTTADEVRDLIDEAKTVAGPSESVYASQVRRRGIARFLAKAQTCKAKGDWAGARLHAALALELDPDNAAALTTAGDARNVAKDLYLRAYSVKETDPERAARLFKAVLTMTPNDDEYHLKAQRRIADEDDAL
jgi:hypothetical protein